MADSKYNLDYAKESGATLRIYGYGDNSNKYATYKVNPETGNYHRVIKPASGDPYFAKSQGEIADVSIQNLMDSPSREVVADFDASAVSESDRAASGDRSFYPVDLSTGAIKSGAGSTTTDSQNNTEADDVSAYDALMEQYDVAGTPWASDLKQFFLTPEALPEDLSDWTVTGGRKNYSITFKDGTSIPLTGLSKYDDEGGRIQQLIDNLSTYRESLPTDVDTGTDTTDTTTTGTTTGTTQPNGTTVTPGTAADGTTTTLPDPVGDTVTPYDPTSGQPIQPNQYVTEVVAPTTYGGGVTTDPVQQSNAVTGTTSMPLDTANLSAVPDTFTYRPNYTGTTMSNLATPSQGQSSIQNVVYKNNLGQSIYVTEVNGQPSTYVPPGFVRQASASQGGMMRNGYADGGMASEDSMLEAKYRIATMNGYNGPKTNAALNTFANSSEGMKRKFNAIGTVMANKGGLMQPASSTAYAIGGLSLGGGSTNNQAFQNKLKAADTSNRRLSLSRPTTPAVGNATSALIQEDTTTQDTTTQDTTTETGGTFQEKQAQMTENLLKQTMQPVQSTVAQIVSDPADYIATTAGRTVQQAPQVEASKVGTVETAQMPTAMTAATMDATTVSPAVRAETAALQAAQGTVSPEAQVEAQQQVASSVTGMEAAQGAAIMMDNPVQREIQQGELISGVADAQKAAQFNEQIQAAQATPTKQATVQGQLETLMQQFEGGNTPAWAAGSMRQATAVLAARGLGASSMAGQAIIQATMEAALPIAQMDAQTQAQFESQNLSNRQQRAMLAAQQRAQFLGQEFDQAFQARVQNSARIGDIANMNFTAEQQIALENSRAANTMELSNLSNRQAMVMAEASALANMDMANLNNRQQAAVQNAQNFLQMDLTNLSNEQQTAMFKSQQNLQALFTDQAAENAAAQFNASSENQTEQFFATLNNQSSQFNAAQTNAMNQFNVNSVNALREFNAEVQQQRDLFNAQNGLVVAQANAQWRQTIATINNAAQNQSNMDFAKTMNALTSTNLDAYWQRERDTMSFAFAASESAADRSANIALAKLTADEQADLQDNIGKGKLIASAADTLLKKWLE